MGDERRKKRQKVRKQNSSSWHSRGNLKETNTALQEDETEQKK